MRGNQRSNTEPKLCMIYSSVRNCILLLAHHHFHGRKGDWDKTHYYKLHYLLNEFIKLRINHSLETSHRVQKSVLYICVSIETYIIQGETDHKPRLDAWDKCSDLVHWLGRPRGIRWRGRWEGGSGWGIHVNPWQKK